MKNLASPSQGEITQDENTQDEFTAVRLARRDRAWTPAMFATDVQARDVTPEGLVLAVFDTLNDLFQRADHEARIFVGILGETNTGRAMSSASIETQAGVRTFLTSLLSDAGFDSNAMSSSMIILMKGAIVRAIGGDLDAARHARLMAVDLIARHNRGSDAQQPIPQFSDIDFDADWYDEADQAFADLAAVGTHYKAPVASRHTTAEISSNAQFEIEAYLAEVEDMQWSLG